MQFEFAEFDADLRAQGYDEVVEVTWPPLKVLELHQPPFEADALLVRGEMWLIIGEDTRHLHPTSPPTGCIPSVTALTAPLTG